MFDPAIWISSGALVVSFVSVSFNIFMSPKPQWKLEKIERSDSLFEDAYFVIRITNIGTGPARDVSVSARIGRDDDQQQPDDPSAIREVRTKNILNAGESLLLVASGLKGEVVLDEDDDPTAPSEDNPKEVITLKWRQPPCIWRIKRKKWKTRKIPWHRL